MEPRLHRGEYVIALGLPRQQYQVGDMVVAVHPVEGTMVRIIADIDSSDRVLLHQLEHSASGVASGWLDKHCLWGKVRWRIDFNPLPALRPASG